MESETTSTVYEMHLSVIAELDAEPHRQQDHDWWRCLQMLQNRSSTENALNVLNLCINRVMRGGSTGGERLKTELKQWFYRLHTGLLRASMLACPVSSHEKMRSSLPGAGRQPCGCSWPLTNRCLRTEMLFWRKHHVEFTRACVLSLCQL